MDPTENEQHVVDSGGAFQMEESSRSELWVNALGAPVVALVTIMLRRSVLGFLFGGFHTWLHEFGHATIAWLSGHRALPLPIGWTNIVPEKSLFVYFGVLFLAGVLGVAGWRERKPVAVAIAVFLVGVQALATWVVPEREVQMWITFGGVGGEFYLSGLMMAAFFFDFPEKFRWPICRWVFLFIGAASFFQTYALWRAIGHRQESIPWGSMIGGEDDAGGDMDTLRDDYRWSESTIVSTYTTLGNVCVAALAVVYVSAVLRSIWRRQRAR